MSPTHEPLNIFFAVFNCSATEEDRARRTFNKHFGQGMYRKHISPLRCTGIMEIFQHPPTKQSKWYVETLAKMVNKRIAEPK